MTENSNAENDAKPAARSRAARIWDWVRWPVAAGVIFLLFWLNRGPFSKLDSIELDWTILIAGFVIFAAGIVTTFLRWSWLVGALGFDFRMRDGLRLGFLGYFMNLVGPGSGGGDLVKAVMVAREQPDRKAAAILTILVDRLIGVIALLIIGFVFCLVYWDGLPSEGAFAVFFWGFAIGSGIGLGIFAFVLSPALRSWKWLDRAQNIRGIGKILHELIEAGRAYSRNHRVLWAAFGISFVGHLLVNTGFWLCAIALFSPAGVPLWVENFQFMPAAQLFAGLVPTPGGIGGLEAAAAFFFELVGGADSNIRGLLSAVTYRLMTVVLAAIGSVYYFANRRAIRAAENQ